MQDVRILRMSLITRLQSASVIARNKGIPTLVNSCMAKIVTLKNAFDNELPMHVDGVADIERSCINAPSMADIRASYARFSSTVPHGGEGASLTPEAPSIHSNRKAA
jgi:hypothetical protein